MGRSGIRVRGFGLLLAKSCRLGMPLQTPKITHWSQIDLTLPQNAFFKVEFNKEVEADIFVNFESNLGVLLGVASERYSRGLFN